MTRSAARLIPLLIPFLGIASGAMAGDAAVAPRWEGVYAGANVGESWLSGDVAAFTPYNNFNGYPVGGLNSDGFNWGGQVGYNHQMGHIGIGAEVMSTFKDLKAVSAADAPGVTVWRKAKFTASIAPRLSYATPDMIFYLKGGIAMGEFQVGMDQNGTPISKSNSKTGYVLGGGAEYAVTPRVSVGFQYDVMNFSHERINLTGNPNVSIDQHSHMDTARAVVNYRF